MEPLLPVSSGDPHVQAHNQERERINELIAWIEEHQAVGTGFPYTILEGAPVGTKYIDEDETNGAREWIRYGDDLIEWKVTNGDTGWRKLVPKVAHLSTAVSSLLIKRVNDQVFLSPSGPALTGTALAANASIFDIGDGFRPHTAQGLSNGVWGITPGETAFPRRCVIERGVNTWDPFQVILAGSSALTTGTLMFVWSPIYTGDPWPFDLPGTPEPPPA